jgi:hypothetical protein
MEYLADWHVIERSDADLRRLIATACGPTVRFDLRTEPPDSPGSFPLPSLRQLWRR